MAGGKTLPVLKYREQRKENREKVVVLVVFNVRGKGGNLREFFFLGGGGTVQFTFPRIQRMKNLR